MRVIPPLEITDARLDSSTMTDPYAPTAYNAGTTYSAGDIVSVAADFTIYESLVSPNLAHTPSSSPTWWKVLGPTEAAYNGGTTYGLGATASSTTTHRVYISLQADNVGNDLPVLPLKETAFWKDIGATNKWRMFDTYRSTRTVQASPLTVEIRPGERVNAIALLGLDATEVTVTMSSGGSEVYADTEDMNAREVADWYDYFYEPLSTRPSLALFDLPPYSSSLITVVITNTGGNAACGALVVGSYQYIGWMVYGSVIDTLNFSTISRDDFNTEDVTLIPRRSVPKTQHKVICDKGLVNAVRKLKVALDAKPAVYSGLDDMTDVYAESFLILGIYREFPITPTEFGYSEIDLVLEEL